MGGQERNLILLLRSAINGSPCHPIEPDYVEILQLAQRHCVSNLLYYAVKMLPSDLWPAADILQEMKQLAFAAVTREAVQQKELQTLFTAFESEKLHVLPLKGCRLKELYPKPEFRYMSDTDLLFNAADATRVRVCMEQMGFQCTRFDVGSTDLYFSPLGMYYELHRDLGDEACNAQGETFLKSLLQRSVAWNEYRYVLELAPEEHYAYVLCHIVKHLINGGTGIRSVLDVWICRKFWQLDEIKLTGLLDFLKLTQFARTIERLAGVWFGDVPPDPVTEELGAYLFNSGVFGKEELRVADRMLRQERQGSKLRYVCGRLFPPFATMRGYYPILKKLPVLLPLFWLWRIAEALIQRHKKIGRELAVFNETDHEAVRRRSEFYERCGLRLDQMKWRKE